MDTGQPRRRSRHALGAAALAALTLAPRAASAMINLGVGAGVADRAADRSALSPGLDTGLAFGAHAELSLLPLLGAGPYYLHYALGQGGDRSTVFHAVGLRARLKLPLPVTDFKPYAFAGAGFTFGRYAEFDAALAADDQRARVVAVERGVRFFETPLGVGLLYPLASVLELSVDAAVRPGFGFSGDVYEEPKLVAEPGFGYSILAGVALDL